MRRSYFASLLILGLFSNLARGETNVPEKTSGSIEVDMAGTIRTGIIAPGGETTGTTITSLGFTWELDFQGNKENMNAAAMLKNKEANVKGTLTVKSGIEVKQRYIVQVKSIRPLSN